MVTKVVKALIFLYGTKAIIDTFCTWGAGIAPSGVTPVFARRTSAPELESEYITRQASASITTLKQWSQRPACSNH